MAGKFDEYKTALPQILEDSKTKLTEKGVQVPEDAKFDDLPDLIATVEVGSKVEIVVTAPDYEGETLTCKKDQTELTAMVNSGECRFTVNEEGTWTVSATDGKSVEVEVKFKFEGNLSLHGVYGIKITESESDPTGRVTYTDDAIGMKPLFNNLENGTCDYGSWKNTWIFRKIYPVMLKTSGEIDYRLDPNDQTLKAEGGTSDISNINYDGNAMVCIEKFYTKFSMNGSNEEIRISDQPQDGFEPIGFVRSDGSVADRIFLPMFGGFKDSSGKLRSLSGQTFTYSISWTDSVTAAEKNGNGYGICSFAMNEAFSAVLTILIKSCDWQKKLGEGRQYSNAKTGILTNKGAFGYDPSTKTVKVLWVEDFVSAYSGGMFWWESGILATNSKLYVKMKPPYSGTSTSGYDQVTDHVLRAGNISKMKCSNSYGRYPIEYQGSQTTCETAYWYTNTGSDVFVSHRAINCGVWGRFIGHVASITNGGFCASLSFLPPAEVVYE